MKEANNMDNTDAWIDTLQASRSIQRLTVLAEDSTDPATVLDLLHAIGVLAARISAMAEKHQVE